MSRRRWEKYSLEFK